MSGVGMSKDKDRLIEELIRGRDSVIQLKALLMSETAGDEKAVLADEILGKILGSFSESISVMGTCESASASVDLAPGDSGESNKRSGSKQARGCYKRRRGSESWTTVASSVEDGHAWRKYGQKEILNSKFPRCYFRCTHKHDQGCKAIKQVQKMEDRPNMYRITYIGQHSCREITNAPQMIPDSDPWEESKQHHDNPLPPVKDEHKDDAVSDLTDCISGFDHGFHDLPGLGPLAAPTTDFSSWSFSDDGFRDFPDMSRYISFHGDFQFPESELLL